MSFTPISRFLDNYFTSESNFCLLYPLSMQQLDQAHWSPLLIIKKAMQFLADEPGTRVLDIGSGIGKFCLTGAYYKPSAFFYGVEQRKSLVAHAETARTILGLQNVEFINRNFSQLDFTQYDHFYFYNSFYENLVGTDKIDDAIEYSRGLYNYYNRVLFQKLAEMPTGTKLVTFQSLESEIPGSYHHVNNRFDDLLKFWMKI